MSAEPVPGPGEDGDPRRDADRRPGQDTGPDDTRDSSQDGTQTGTPQEIIAAGGYGVWGLEDAEAGQDPDSSSPAGVCRGCPHREIFAAADAWEAGHPQAAESPGTPGSCPATSRRWPGAPGRRAGSRRVARWMAPRPTWLSPISPRRSPARTAAAPGRRDDELIGVLGSWQRQESRAAARKLAVIAELIRRRPAPGCAPPVPGGMPRAWGKFCAMSWPPRPRVPGRPRRRPWPWPTTWPPGCPAPPRPCTTGRSTPIRRGSSLMRPGSWTRPGRRRRRRWCCRASRGRRRGRSAPRSPAR